MPHPRPDDRQELPEYPVRGSSARRRRPPTVWERYPLASRLGAVVVAALLVGGVLSLVRGDDSSAAAEGLVIDPAAASVDGGLAADDGSLASSASPSDAPVPVPAPAAAPFVEGTLPMREGTLPPTVATTPAPTKAPLVTAAQRNAAPATTKPAVVKPAATTAKKATPATTAKAVAKPAAPTTKATTAATQPKAAIVKPPPTAATPKTTKPAPATTVPKTSYTADEVVALIRAVWPADSVDKALDVAYRESRYRHTAYNGWCCYGVFQINASAHRARLAARGLGVDGLYDPRVNIEIALEIFQGSGWAPWGG
jgi:Transglycosylase SLT domain